MTDNFDSLLWELGSNSPEMQKAIARTIAKEESYAIPVRRVSKATGELETLTTTIFEVEDPEVRERAVADLKQALALTVKDLAKRLNILHIAYKVKEAQGEELTPQERTLRDLDITALAYTLRYMNYPKEAHQTYANGTELDRKLKEIREEKNK